MNRKPEPVPVQSPKAEVRGLSIHDHACGLHGGIQSRRWGRSGRLVQRAGSQTACAGAWEAEIKGWENSRFFKATLSQKRVTEVSSVSAPAGFVLFFYMQGGDCPHVKDVWEDVSNKRSWVALSRITGRKEYFSAV